MPVSMLPIIRYERRRWFFDARLHQLRTVDAPIEFQDLNDFEMAYFADLVAKGKVEKLTLHA